MAYRVAGGGLASWALVHKRDARSAAPEQLGAEIVVADLFDPDQLLDAMQGVARGYYCPPWHPYMLQSARGYAVAARKGAARSHRRADAM